jgi:hypothetical protein
MNVRMMTKRRSVFRQSFQLSCHYVVMNTRAPERVRFGFLALVISVLIYRTVAALLIKEICVHEQASAVSAVSRVAQKGVC